MNWEGHDLEIPPPLGRQAYSRCSRNSKHSRLGRHGRCNRHSRYGNQVQNP